MLGWLYAQIANTRNALFDRGILKTHDLGAPAISVGNITFGGTGKTPLVAYIAELLATNGEKVCILTRGYGRKEPNSRVLVSDWNAILTKPEYSGDEPFELAQKLLGKAIVLADPDRVSAARWAKENYGITAFVLDDAFQHRRARRDLDVVCIDATDPFGHKKHRGVLREPVSGLKRAGVMVITRADLVNDIVGLRSELTRINPECPVFAVSNRTSAIQSIDGADEISIEKIRGKRIYAFCGIGNPEGFFAQLKNEGFDLAGTMDFHDHHPYSQTDIDEIENAAGSVEADLLLTTVKDSVKLTGLTFTVPCYRLETELVIEEKEEFDRVLLGVIKP